MINKGFAGSAEKFAVTPPRSAFGPPSLELVWSRAEPPEDHTLTFGAWYTEHAQEVSRLGDAWIAVDPGTGTIVHSVADDTEHDELVTRWMSEHGRPLWSFHTRGLGGRA
jgi:hypothetical protein